MKEVELSDLVVSNMASNVKSVNVKSLVARPSELKPE
ncbi:MAG: hypothetical protein ACJA1U_002916 [Bermanella sp.]|jgi:hypothetical protein